MSVEARRPAYQVLADELLAQITSGQLRPGDRLPTEPQLCASSGVSRSTVREALRLLASQNLIVTTRGVAGGSFVAFPSPAQVSASLGTGVHLLLANSVVGTKELLEVRGMLEIPAAALAAVHRTEEHLVTLRSTMLDAWDADLEQLLVAHNVFHVAIAEASGNSLLCLLARPLYLMANQREISEAITRELWAVVIDDHRAILHEVERGDPEAARAAAAAHIDRLMAASATNEGQLSDPGLLNVAGGA
ncbi:MAG: FadR/GntR family transcriptional regulator [Micromonosporaceae bacterium]